MDEILINLYKIKDLRVPGRTTLEQYRNPTKSIPQIAKELGVNYIVEGSGQRYGNTIRLRIQLLEGGSDQHLWGESYEQVIESTADIFRIQSQIAQAIAEELKAVITPQEKDLIEKMPTKELEAYDAYLKGRYYHGKLTRNDLDTAMQYFEMAKEKDPEFALAYTGIGRVWLGREQMGIVSPSEATPKAEEAVKRALELDSSYSDVYHLLGGIRTWSRWDWKGGEAAYRKAIELDPRNADAHSAYSHVLNIMGRKDEALKHIDTALGIDPLNSKILAFHAQDLMFMRRYNDAVKAFEKALDLNPSQGVAVNIISALYFAGREAEATEMLKKFYNDKESLNAIDKGYNEGGFQGAMKLIADVRSERSKITSTGFYGIAHEYALAGDSENALRWLEKAYKAHDPNLPYLLVPAFDIVREDPRFQEIARKMNLPYK
jgi:TolB-like protein/Tfp pilus assembly protein PilF